MHLDVERDSVTMGDDVTAPHYERWELPDDATVGDVLTAVATRRYLARIQGGKATWVVCAGTTPIGVVAQQWEHPRAFGDPDAPYPGGLVHAHYLTQRDPQAVFDAVKTGGLAAGRKVGTVRAP